MNGSKNSMVFLLYKHMYDLGLHCIIHQQNINSKALGFKQIMNNVINAVRSCGGKPQTAYGIP